MGFSGPYPKTSGTIAETKSDGAYCTQIAKSILNVDGDKLAKFILAVLWRALD